MIKITISKIYISNKSILYIYIYISINFYPRTILDINFNLIKIT